nr:LamG domain-containing protein [Ignavibacteria bacterium]
MPDGVTQIIIITSVFYPFQGDDNSGAPFQIADESRYNHTITSHNVTAVSLSNRPSVTNSDNLSVHLNGSTDYIAGPDHLNNSPDNQLTMEAWVYPERIYNGGFSDFGTIIFKGFAATNYRMFLGANNSVYVTINGNGNFGYAGDISAPPNQWTHIAFTYAASTGNYAYYVNGTLAGSGVNNIGNIVNGTDSLYIGQSNGGNFFQGYIDEVRIAAYTKSQSQINDFVYKSMDLGNRPSAFELSSYNFDGNLTNNNGVLPRLYFRNGAVFSSRYISSNKNFP